MKSKRKGNRKYKRIMVDDKNGLPRIVYILKGKPQPKLETSTEKKT